MRIAVTGQQGQVVQAIRAQAADDAVVVALGRPGLDLARPETIAASLAAAQPDLIVSAAAYTAVDKAESERDLAFAVNATGAAAVAAAALRLNVPVIHISTDYVFDGAKGAPYTEADAVGPLNVYGASKLAGEQAVMAANPEAVVLRASWIYSPFGHNFVRTMLRLAAEREEVGVVADQFGSPTSALDLADGIWALASRLLGGSAASPRGVFHMAGSGNASWADLAEATFSASAALGGPSARVRRIDAAQFPTAAVRPTDSRLDCGRLEAAFGIRLPDWRASIAAVVRRLIAP